MGADSWRAIGEIIVTLCIVIAFVTVKIFAPNSDDVALWGAILGGLSGYWFGRSASGPTGGAGKGGSSGQ